MEEVDHVKIHHYGLHDLLVSILHLWDSDSEDAVDGSLVFAFSSCVK